MQIILLLRAYNSAVKLLGSWLNLKKKKNLADSYASFKDLDSESKHTTILLDALESTSSTTRELCFNTNEADFQLVLAFVKVSIYFKTKQFVIPNFSKGISEK